MAKVMKPVKKMLSKMKSPMKSAPKVILPKKPVADSFMKYLLVGALVILVGFTVVYIYNIHQMSMKLEKFTDVSVKPNLKILYVYSPTCGHCKAFNGTFEEASKRLNVDNDITSKFSLDIGKQQISDIPERYSAEVSVVPTVLILKNGDVVNKLSGNRSVDDVVTEVKASLKKLT